MTQEEREKALIAYLLKENLDYSNISIPENSEERKQLLRGLVNVRPPKAISEAFLSLQDEYLKEELRKRGIVTLAETEEKEKDIYLWQGDITRLQVEAIVNAANSGMTGCYVPSHNCIDNCIHTFAGVQLRAECAQLMKKQGYDEPTGRAKITSAYNLPSRFVIHTVGPIIDKAVSVEAEELLASCYLSSLRLAEKNKCSSIAFCCISTGVFRFPNHRAAEIAVKTVREYKRNTGSGIKVVFNVWKDEDKEIYEDLLG